MEERLKEFVLNVISQPDNIIYVGLNIFSHPCYDYKLSDNRVLRITIYERNMSAPKQLMIEVYDPDKNHLNERCVDLIRETINITNDEYVKYVYFAQLATNILADRTLTELGY